MERGKVASAAQERCRQEQYSIPHRDGMEATLGKIAQFLK